MFLQCKVAEVDFSARNHIPLPIALESAQVWICSSPRPENPQIARFSSCGMAWYPQRSRFLPVAVEPMNRL